MTPEKFKRKLTAILSADVKGYSRLIGEDEEGTIRTLKAYMEVISGFIQQHRGRIVSTGGDSILAEFASVVDAVRCAVGIQEELKDRNKDLPEGRRMEFRIGINLGDVVEEGDNILGDGVNIAARVQSLAEAGGICISGMVYENIRNKLAFGYDYVGEQVVKNIKEPVRVYRVLMEPGVTKVGKGLRGKVKGKRALVLGILAAFVGVAAVVALWQFYLPPAPPPHEVASKEKMAFPLPDKPSIAVLPFVNMSGDPKKDYLSDGITEEIINALSKIPHIFVIARNSTFTYKGKSVKVQQVAEEMGVQYVLEGSVQWSGDRVRITAQLIDALNGHHLLSERFDRELKDLFAMQDEVTMKIATAMRVQLTEGEFARAFAKGTKNLEAYLKELQAYEKRQLYTKESQARARQLTEEAIALDPGYAMPYSELAAALGNEVMMGVYKNPGEVLARAMEMAQKAVAIDESLAAAHTRLGFIYIMYKKDYDKGIAEAERAVALEPNSADLVGQLAIFLFWAGRCEEAIPISKKAMRFSPIPQPRWLFAMAGCYDMMGQYEEAISIGKKIVEKQPDQSFAHIQLAVTYMAVGKEREARAEAAEIIRIDPKFSLENYAKATPRKNPAEVARMVELLRKAGLK